MPEDEALTQTYLAALQAVPTYIWPYLVQDERQNHTKRGLDAKTMKMLDALAAVCVCAPSASETYSTALMVAPDQLTLLVATTGPASGAVPDHAEQRLRAVWRYMQALNSNSNRSRGSDIQYQAREFAVEQYRYALPALRARFSHDAVIVLDSMRQVLRDPASLPGRDDAVLECLDMHTFALTDSQGQLLRQCVASLEIMRRLLAENYPDSSDTDLLDIALGLQELYIATKDMLETGYASVFVLVDVACRVPVRYHLRRILWLAEACIVIPAFAASQSATPLLAQALSIHRIPPLSPRVAIELHETEITDSASFVYGSLPGQLPFFDADVHTYLLEPLRSLFAGLPVQFEPSSGTESEAHVTVDVPLHSEMLLLRHLDALPSKYGSVSYIGHSELSCLPCFLFLRAYNSCGGPGQRGVYIRGNYGRTAFPWAAPPLASDTSGEVGARFYSEVAGHFMSAWRGFATNQMVGRQSSMPRSGAAVTEDPFLPKLVTSARQLLLSALSKVFW